MNKYMQYIPLKRVKKGIKKQGKTQSVTQMTYHEQKTRKREIHISKSPSFLP